MSSVSLTKRVEFSSSHRYARPEWDEAKNREAFGACYNDPGHGHNYLLEVTVTGEVDPGTGMVVNLFDLKQTLLRVLKEFDHWHLNLDTPYFDHLIPTSENIARVLWNKLVGEPNIGTLQRIRLYEDEDLYADIDGSVGLEVAGVTRRYSINPIPEFEHGPQWDLFVTVHGMIHQETGMVMDIGELDKLVHEQVALMNSREGGEQNDTSQAPTMLSGDVWIQTLWERLDELISGDRLNFIRLEQTRDQAFECSR